jgi:putative PIN family toxin of toxin-antitoxin system
VRVILDTNVFVSGVFFSGPPYQILEAWRDGRPHLVISQEILDEYRRVGRILSIQFPAIDLWPIIELVTVEAEIYPSHTLPETICDDPDDDKFIACAIAGKCKKIVSGDKHLLKVSGFKGIDIIKPREFVDKYLP